MIVCICAMPAVTDYICLLKIELLSRFGQESSDVVMDGLGGEGWQSRKARIEAALRKWRIS